MSIIMKLKQEDSMIFGGLVGKGARQDSIGQDKRRIVSHHLP